MTEFFYVATAVSLVFCLILSLLVARIAARVSELKALAQRSNESPSALLSERLSELEETVSLLANRVKMMKVRSAAVHTDKPNGPEPDPYRDPAAWREAMNRQISRNKLASM